MLWLPNRTTGEEEYIYSSARDFYNKKGCLELANFKR